jgi:hypothetical protein
MDCLLGSFLYLSAYTLYSLPGDSLCLCRGSTVLGLCSHACRQVTYTLYSSFMHFIVATLHSLVFFFCSCFSPDACCLLPSYRKSGSALEEEHCLLYVSSLEILLQLSCLSALRAAPSPSLSLTAWTYSGGSHWDRTPACGLAPTCTHLQPLLRTLDLPWFINFSALLQFAWSSACHWAATTRHSAGWTTCVCGHFSAVLLYCLRLARQDCGRPAGRTTACHLPLSPSYTPHCCTCGAVCHHPLPVSLLVSHPAAPTTTPLSAFLYLCVFLPLTPPLRLHCYHCHFWLLGSLPVPVLYSSLTVWLDILDSACPLPGTLHY